MEQEGAKLAESRLKGGKHMQIVVTALSRALAIKRKKQLGWQLKGGGGRFRPQIAFQRTRQSLELNSLALMDTPQ